MLHEGQEYIKREITKLYAYFAESVSEDIVDLNLEYYPDYIIVTFLSYQDVQKALKRKVFKYQSSNFSQELTFEAMPVNFTVHVRNCNFPNDSPAIKYLPVYADKERATKCKLEQMSQKKKID